MNDNETVWVIEDMPDDAREAAIAAARQEGISVGEWITNMLRAKLTPPKKGGEA